MNAIKISMPEVAEVALTAEILTKYLRGKRLITFDFVQGRYSKKNPVGFEDFDKALPLTVKKVDSKGKFLWFELYDPKTNDKWYIWNTFGLTGMWSLTQPEKYVKAILNFNKNRSAYFSDTRNFGTFKFSNSPEELTKKLSTLGPDFLKDDDFNLSKIQKYKVPIVKILMDQKKAGSGIGNYLVAEILYRAKISPHRLGTEMSDDDIKNLTYWIKYVTKLAYVDNHVGYMVNLEDIADKIKRKDYHPGIKLKQKTFKFLVYGKKEDAAGNKVQIDKIVGSGENKRSTYWVPAVQK